MIPLAPWRHLPAGSVPVGEGAGDETNRTIAGAVQAAGDLYLRGTVLHGHEALRVCFMHHATTTDDVDRIVPAVHHATQVTP